MRIHYLQHVPFEGLAYIQDWLENNSHDISCSKLFQNDHLPQQSEFDGLIVMGGPMGVYDENKYPWIVKEKKFIEQTIKANKTVIGICLGAQMIADVLGGRVYPGQQKEIGWFPIRLTNNHTLINSIWPAEFHAFHWHGDTFDIPQGAIHFAESDACKNQGFIYQQNVFAFQFHLESTQQSIEQLILNCGHELEETTTYIQDAAAIREGATFIADCNRHLKAFLEAVTGLGTSDDR